MAEESNSQLLLFRAIDERLSYMEDVALFKAQNQAPIEDLAREKVVLSDSRSLASRHGLEPTSMEGFFLAQINAAKAIQYRYRAELLTRELPSHTLDLSTEIRPALDRLSNDIVTLFSTLLQSSTAIAESSRDTFKNSQQSRLLEDAEINALFDSMLEVRRASN